MKTQWIFDPLPDIIHYPLLVVGTVVGLVMLWTMLVGSKGDR